MSNDFIDSQELALALARTLEDEDVIPREAEPSPALATKFSFVLQAGEVLLDPTRLGDRLLVELDRLGYSVVRAR